MAKAIDIVGEEFRRMQLIQLDMLEEFDRVCRENNIRYTIIGGTLLGAIRHGGYIPWDDDADIAMLREDYEQFKKIADKLNPEICFFQDNTTDPYYRWGYGKLRRTGTTFIRAGQEHMKGQTGVFVDVFPIDDVPNSLIGQMLLDFRFFVYRKILWSEVGRLAESQSPFMRKVYGALSHIDHKTVFKHVEKQAKKSRNDSPNRVRILLFPSLGKYYWKHPLKDRYGMPKEWYLDTAEYDFENLKLIGARDYDGMLTYFFKDYMTLPPEDKREPHAPVSSYDFGNLRKD